MAVGGESENRQADRAQTAKPNAFTLEIVFPKKKAAKSITHTRLRLPTTAWLTADILTNVARETRCCPSVADKYNSKVRLKEPFDSSISRGNDPSENKDHIGRAMGIHINLVAL